MTAGMCRQVLLRDEVNGSRRLKIVWPAWDVTIGGEPSGRASAR